MHVCVSFFIYLSMIGIITNIGMSSEGNNIYYIYQSFFKLGYDYLIIPLTNIDDIKSKIDKCKGIIMQGGDDYLDIHLEIIKYIYDIDMPLLAICMSMQAMGVLFNGKLKNIFNHKDRNKYSHYVTIKGNTLLYKILGCNKLLVNSSHKECLEYTALTVSAYSNCIEAIEDTSKKFFLGIQWHPEKMIEYDKLERKIFEYFYQVINK